MSTQILYSRSHASLLGQSRETGIDGETEKYIFAIHQQGEKLHTECIKGIKALQMNSKLCKLLKNRLKSGGHEK